MTNQPESEKPKEEEPSPPGVETAGGQFVNESEESMTVPQPQGKPWWERLMDKVRGR